MPSMEIRFTLGQKVFIAEGSNSTYRPRIVRGILVRADEVLYDLRDLPTHSPNWVSEKYVRTREEALVCLLSKHKQELSEFFQNE